NDNMDVDTNGARQIAIKRKQPDSGLTDNVMKKSKLQSSTLQVAVHSSSLQQNEEKKIEEVIFENVEKGYESATAIHVFQRSNDCRYARNTFSGNFRTLFVHFAVDVNEQQLNQLAIHESENEIKETLDYGTRGKKIP
ncbi:hypothetical protein RFI_39773, partial [Reticulomyxa filosa]